jgi:hypothetical protein
MSPEHQRVLRDPALSISYAVAMDTHADPSEIGRALASVRWSPEVRLRSAVDYAAGHAAEMDDAQRAKLEDAISREADDE